MNVCILLLFPSVSAGTRRDQTAGLVGHRCRAPRRTGQTGRLQHVQRNMFVPRSAFMKTVFHQFHTYIHVMNVVPCDSIHATIWFYAISCMEMAWHNRVEPYQSIQTYIEFKVLTILIVLI